MKKTLSLICAITFSFLTSLALAHDKVIIVPLLSNDKLANVVIVPKKKGKYDDPVTSTVNLITDASAENPYIVVIGPGVFYLNQQLTMKPYIAIVGAGQESTTLTRGRDLSGVGRNWLVVGANNATLRDLTLKDVTQTLWETRPGGTRVIFNNDCSPIFKNISIIARGLLFYPNYGMWNSSSSPILDNVLINMGTVALINEDKYSIYNIDSSYPEIRNSRLGNVYLNGGTTIISHSSIIGGSILNEGGTIVCLNSNNGIDKELNKNCAEISLSL